MSRATSRLRVGGASAVEGATLKAILRDKNASRVEIDQRARDARLQLKHIERLLVSTRRRDRFVAETRALCLFSVRSYTTGEQGRRTPWPLSNRRPSRVSEIDNGSMIPAAA